MDVVFCSVSHSVLSLPGNAICTNVADCVPPYQKAPSTSHANFCLPWRQTKGKKANQDGKWMEEAPCSDEEAEQAGRELTCTEQELDVRLKGLGRKWMQTGLYVTYGSLCSYTSESFLVDMKSCAWLCKAH